MDSLLDKKWWKWGKSWGLRLGIGLQLQAQFDKEMEMSRKKDRAEY